MKKSIQDANKIEINKQRAIAIKEQKKELLTGTEFTNLYIEPYDIHRDKYNPKLSLTRYIDVVVKEYQFEQQFALDIVRNVNLVDSVPTNFEKISKGSRQTEYKPLSDMFDNFLKEYDPDITDEVLIQFKKLNCQHAIILNGVNLGHYFNNAYSFKPIPETVTYDHILKKKYVLINNTSYNIVMKYQEESFGNATYNTIYDITNNTYSSTIKLNFDYEKIDEFILQHLFNEEYNNDYNNEVHHYSNQLFLSIITQSVKTNPHVVFEKDFIQDIKRIHNCTVNNDPTNIDIGKLIDNGQFELTDDDKSIQYVSNTFNNFIRRYVPSIDEDILNTFKFLHIQKIQSLVINWLNPKIKPLILTGINVAYHYTLMEYNYILKITVNYVIQSIDSLEEKIGSGSSSMVFDISDDSYSAEINLHLNQPAKHGFLSNFPRLFSGTDTEPASQDECFTFVKRLFRTGGTRKKSKVYGMPYTYRKVYRKKCYKVSNRLTKRVFAKCTTKKKALKQLRLLRYLESK